MDLWNGVSSDNAINVDLNNGVDMIEN